MNAYGIKAIRMIGDIIPLNANMLMLTATNVASDIATYRTALNKNIITPPS